MVESIEQSFTVTVVVRQSVYVLDQFHQLYRRGLGGSSVQLVHDNTERVKQSMTIC